MLVAEIKLNLCDGYEVDGVSERGDKVRIIIRLAECDVELVLPKDNTLGDEIIQASMQPNDR